VEFCPAVKIHNQPKNSDSNCGGHLFLKKFSVTAQSYVSSSKSDSPEMSNSALEDDTYEPFSTSSYVIMINNLSSDGICYDMLVAENNSESFSSLPYTSTSLYVDFIRNVFKKPRFNSC
jgi:hypothetical protein